ncbi:MAG: hypothetical protein KBD78_10220 [Oligoflexales bacterium]|nr:hypothetical protein [Oligoflexales bacterium]
MQLDDLAIKPISQALANQKIDVVVTGSIGAVEAVRFIRALRRLGAEVFPCISEGARLFTTETALSWAAANPVQSNFSGTVTHLATRDACIIAPCSADFAGKIAAGLCDQVSLALVASYLGQKKPVLLLPNMHNSLYNSPFIQIALGKLAENGVTVINSREEEDKQKFPDPKILADQLAHVINRKKFISTNSSAAVIMGSTRAYIDDVRYISNYSSGRLGCLITDELYRQGVFTKVVCGPAKFMPLNYNSLVNVETHEELKTQSIKAALESDSVIMLASVLDFVPDRKISGKVSSQSDFNNISLKKTEKILPLLKPKRGFKIGFKLESLSDAAKMAEIAHNYLDKNDLNFLVYNYLKDVSAENHRAQIFYFDETKKLLNKEIDGKAKLAATIAELLVSLLKKDF